MIHVNAGVASDVFMKKVWIWHEGGFGALTMDAFHHARPHFVRIY